MSTSDAIDKWGLVELFSKAVKNESWIEAVCLGYTMLEMQLTYLMRSKACPSGKPLSDSEIKKCNYLIDLANLANTNEFLPDKMLEDIKKFNKLRRKAIHRLLTEEVFYLELKEAAKLSSDIYGRIQDLWLPIKWGETETRTQ